MSPSPGPARTITAFAAAALAAGSGALVFATPAHAAPCEGGGRAVGTCVEITMATPRTGDGLAPGVHQLQATARQTVPGRGVIRDLEWWLISPDFSDQHPGNIHDKLLLDGKNDVNLMAGSFTGSFTVPADGVFVSQRDGDFDNPAPRAYVLDPAKTYRIEAHALDQQWHLDYEAKLDTGQPPGVSTPAAVSFSFTQAPDKPPATFTRLAGPDRYATAVAISRSAFPGRAPRAFVASGENFADALSGAPLAAYSNGPLLLVPRSGTLPGVVADELRRLGSTDITIIGGNSAVSAGMESQVRGIGGGERYAGTDRYDTARIASESTGPAGGTVFIASGVAFPDALAGAAAAGELGGRLLLTEPGDVPAATREGLLAGKPSNIVVLGGTAAVSQDVVTQLGGIGTGTAISRLAGNDRFETATAVSRMAFPNAGATGVLLATGANFPDALAGAAIAGPTNRPLLLTRQDCAPAATVEEIRRLATSGVTALGGAAAISERSGQLTPC